MAVCVEYFELRTTSPTFPFGDLAFDIQWYIALSFLSPGDLYSFTLVSKQMSALVKPILYRNVRLLPGLKLRSHPEETLAKSLMYCQRLFAREVLAHPSPACDVRRLEWQMCHSFTDVDGPGHVLTSVFPKLQNVQMIHLIDAHPTTMAELNLVVPLLFPRVHDVTLRGVTYFPFIAPLLHSPHQLSALSLDMVSPHSVNVQLLRWITVTKLPTLKKLSFKTTCAINLQREDEVLKGWKDALFSVRGTIETVALGLISQPTRLISVDDQQRFSTKFTTVIRPIFLDEMWPQLGQIQLDGIYIHSIGALSAALGSRGMMPKLLVDSTIPQAQRIWH